MPATAAGLHAGPPPAFTAARSQAALSALVDSRVRAVVSATLAEQPNGDLLLSITGNAKKVQVKYRTSTGHKRARTVSCVRAPVLSS